MAESDRVARQGVRWCPIFGCSVFEADRSNLLGSVEAALDAGDPQALERAAHTVKGAVAVFGAEPARSRAERLETLGRDGDVEGAPAVYSELREWVVRLGDDLQGAGGRTQPLTRVPGAVGSGGPEVPRYSPPGGPAFTRTSLTSTCTTIGSSSPAIIARNCSS